MYLLGPVSFDLSGKRKYKPHDSYIIKNYVHDKNTTSYREIIWVHKPYTMK